VIAAVQHRKITNNQAFATLPLAFARGVPASRLRFAQALRRWLSFSYEQSELEKLALCER
jgi:hypothetical protein